MEYPANWTKSEINLRPYDVAFFYPPHVNGSGGLIGRPNILPFSFVINAPPRSSMDINESGYSGL